MARTTGNVVLLHGRGLKPPRAQLQDLWFRALARGLERRAPHLLPGLESMTRTFLYYGDLSNQFLGEDCRDIEVRSAILESLNQADFSIFPGQTNYSIEQPPEDIEAYWDLNHPFSQQLRTRVADDIRQILDTGLDTILFAHSLGAVLIYDALGELARSHSSLTLVTLAPL